MIPEGGWAMLLHLSHGGLLVVGDAASLFLGCTGIVFLAKWSIYDQSDPL